MEARARSLLSVQDDDVLFAHGGCHIFAQVLHEHYGYPLISVRDGAGEHNHVACSTEEDNVLDVYGWWTRVAYIKEEGADLGIGFYPLELDELKKQFVSGRGKGFYVHPDFEDPARDRAKRWIEAYRAYYDGTNKCPIPGLSRVKKASGSHIHSVFREDPASSKSGG